MRKIIAISINTVPKRYVSQTFNRFNGSIAAEYTDDKNLAHDFLTMNVAERVTRVLYNPWGRTFRAESVKVVQPERVLELEERMS